MPTHRNVPDADVVICGGGLAGLTLGLQLRGRLPEASIVILERQRRPLAEACHKVGESTVEVGARYFGEVLGLREYLLSRHLPKNGLRFFSGPSARPLEARSEMGPRESPSVPAYQIDRGRFENDLRARCEEWKIDLREGWGVRDVSLNTGGEPHRVTAVPTRAGASPQTITARWVVDATGRRRMFAKALGLHRDLPAQASSSWFRIAERLDVTSLASADAREWRDRDVDGRRWLSTNHLCGTGYWVWIIPLGSGHTSVGIVAEDAAHDFRSFSTEETARAWLEAHEPGLAARLSGVPFADFIAMKDYRHDVERWISSDRWACVGEAGLFVDPLYSPGSDIIGLGNTLTTELISEDLSSGLNVERLEELNGFLLDWAHLLSRTLCRGSLVMGKPEVFGAKLYWDYFYYWACLCPYFFQELYRLPVEAHRPFRGMLQRYAALNERSQKVLQAWARVAPEEPVQPFVGLPAVATTLSDLHLALLEKKTPEQTLTDMERALDWGEELVSELLLRALRRAGPSHAAELASRIDLSDWPAVRDARLDADEVAPRERRKVLSRPVRDMERSIGKNVAPSSADPSLRELWKLARAPS